MKTRLLLVDDEREFVDTLALRLEARGFLVDTAYAGDAALIKATNKDFDVIVLDVLMPGRSGLDTLRELKVVKPITEVILLTGHATVQTAIDGMKLGAYDFLMKPMEIDDLVDKVTRAHARKAEQDERIRQAAIQQITQTRGW